jgi:hypothetical protein
MGKFTKAESNYIRGIVEGLTLDRYRDSEIVRYLNEEHKISIDESAIRHIRRKMQKDSKPWLQRLRDSEYLYLSSYKERIDCLLRYQMKLNQIVNNPRSNDSTRISAIKELHSIEMDIAQLFLRLPTFNNNLVEQNPEHDFSNMEFQTSISGPEEEDIPTTF